MDFTPNIFDTLPRDCWVEINVAQLTDNMRRIRTAVGKPVLAVVKANAYGHGYLNAARAFLAGGASYLGAANLAEALLLRQAGIDAPILIICGMLPDEMALAAQAGIDFFVWRPEHIPFLQNVDKTKPVRVHLKINTGMGRLGCWPQDAVGLAQAIRKISGVELTGLATHFASAFNPKLPDTDQQIQKFDQTIAALAAVNIRPAIIHAANSSGGLHYPHGRYDMVRMGIAIYGVAGENIPVPDGVKTALTWHARIVSTIELPQGHGVGYESEYVMPHNGRVGILPVGYADGFKRIPKNVNSVLVNGQECKMLGRISMDQCMVDLTGFDDITGAEVVLIGKQGDKEITVKDVAKRWGTNAYDVTCSIAARVPRRVIG